MKKTEAVSGNRRQSAEKMDKKEVRNKKRCFNCGQRNHVGADYLTKTKEPKCFNYGERGHFASKCIKKTVSDTNIVMRSIHTKYVKEMSINVRKIEAVIDIGSDICLMRTDQYIRIGAPKLEKNMIRFHGISSEDNIIIGEFDYDYGQ